MKMIRRLILPIGLYLAVSPLAYAQVTHHVVFEIQPIIKTQTVSQTQDTITLDIATNTPFVIIAENYIGAITSEIIAQGPAAQTPGPQYHCAQISSNLPFTIWTGTQRTAAIPGTPVEQSVRMTVKYENGIKPNLTFKPLQDTTASEAPICSELSI